MIILPHCYPPSQDGSDGEPLIFSLLSFNLDKMLTGMGENGSFNLDKMLSEMGKNGMFNMDKMDWDAFNLDKSEMFIIVQC